MRGVPKSGNLGKFEPVSKAGAETTLEIVYLKVTIGDKRVAEVDEFNYICFVNGTDYMEELRSALGL